MGKTPSNWRSGMVWIKFQNDGVVTSSVNKFYSGRRLKENCRKFGAKEGDLMFLMSGNANKVRTQLSALRMELKQIRFKKKVMNLLHFG